MSRASVRAIEYARIQSEIRRNDAEAKKMEAEAKSFKESKLMIFIQYFLSALIGGILISAFFLETSKNLYDITSSKIAENKKIQKKINKERIELKKRYLEVLIKDASVNAYGTYVYLVKQKYIFVDKTGKYYSEENAAKAHSQACQLLHEYWKLVMEIAEIAKKPQKDLFLEVKQEIAAKLKEGEEKDICPKECRAENGPLRLSPIQRQSLDLIERHVAQVRAGQSLFPPNLLDTFIEQPEFK